MSRRNRSVEDESMRSRIHLHRRNSMQNTTKIDLNKIIVSSVPKEQIEVCEFTPQKEVFWC
jgi:hypothetical protein